MNIFKSIGQWASRAVRKSVEFLPSESVFFGFLRSGTGLVLNEGNLSDGYRKNSLVLSCVSKLALHAIAAPLRAYEDNAPVKGHEIREIIKNPNADMSESMFWIYVMTYLAIGGNCYIHKIRNEYGMVIGLRPYSRAVVTPVISHLSTARSWISSYRYSGSGTSIELPPKDVIHLRWLAIDPQNPWMGYSPIMAAATHVSTDQEATDYINALLKNDAAPRTIFTFKESADVIISKEEKKKLRKKLKEKWGGSNRGGVEVLDSQVEVHRLSLNLQELAFDTLRDVDEARICAVFHVPPVIAGANVGMKYSTYSNYREAKANFVEDTISSLWVLIADQMERGLRSEFKGDWSLHFDTSRVPALQANRGDREKWALDSYNAGLRTRNESRALIGEQPVEDGDAFSEGSIGAVGIVPLRGDGQKKGGRSLQVIRKAITKAAEKFYTEEEAQAHFKAYDDVAEESAGNIATGIAKAFGELEKEILKQVGKASKSLALDDVLSFWDEDFFKDLLTKHSEDDVQLLIEAMLQQSVANVGADWDKVGSVFDDLMNDLLEQSTSKIVESDATVKEEMKELLKSVRDLPFDEIKTAIRERFTQYSDSRAKTIARTTATYATGAAQTTAWTELGFEYAWLSQRDSAVRKSHKKADGTKPDKKGWFKVGRDRMKHPGGGSLAEENVNCRCMLIPEQRNGEKSYFIFYIDKKAIVRRAA